MTDIINKHHISERDLARFATSGRTVVPSHSAAEYDPFCPAWLRAAENQPETTSPDTQAASNKPTRSRSRKQKHAPGALHLEISLPTSNPDFNNVPTSSTSSLQRNQSMSKRKPEKLTFKPTQFPLSVYERQRSCGQTSESPMPNFKPPQLSQKSDQVYKKVSSPMRTEFFNHELTNDVKFQYQQQIIEFLNYTIGKYKQLEKYVDASKLEWNETSEKSLVLSNLMRIKEGFKDMILRIMKQLSKESGIIDHKEVCESELINCNVFQFVYNCSIEVVNFGDLINNSGLFNNVFKFSLLSYYYKLDFVLAQAVHHRGHLAIAMEVWHKLPTFIKCIKDQLAKLNNHNMKLGVNNVVKRNYQDLEICLVKLSSVTSKFATVDNLKRNYPILKWTDLVRVDELLKVKVPEYYPQHNLTQLQFVDFSSRPLSTAVDTSIVNGLHSNYKLDVKATGTKKETDFKGKQDETESKPSRSKSTLSRGISIKRSLSAMVKRSVSTTSNSDKNKTNKLHTLTDILTQSPDNGPKRQPSRSSSKQPQISRSQTTKSRNPSPLTKSTQQEDVLLQVTTPPRRNQSLNLHKSEQRLDLVDEDASPSSTQPPPARSPSKKDIQLMLKNRPLPTAPENTPQRENKRQEGAKGEQLQQPQQLQLQQQQSLPNSQMANYVTCLVQLRKKLKALGPQLIEFLEIQLKYCRLWQKFLGDDVDGNDGDGAAQINHHSQNKDDHYIKSIYQSFHEKLLHQINFTQHTIVRHINSKLIMPIDECLQMYNGRRTLTDLSYIHQFMELIVRQYNKLYCEWLEGLIGAQSIAEYQQLCDRMIGCPGMKKGDDIVEYYEQLTKLKNLVV
ncbi:FAV1 [Candida theae]|uniref:FAV1 n=1 Tax=Candida theae TaxID=1198502 RepID=A0AAD5BFZ2_9ASCO|nr:FAV1 [Candida theae]KAI5958667.1 FAV1 [Candida theae]